MKNLIYILFILFTIGMVTTTFSQTCKLTLDDILTVDSRENFERVLIENNFQNLNLNKEWDKIFEKMSKTDTLLIAYEFEGTIKYSMSPQVINAFGYFSSKREIDSSDNYSLAFTMMNAEDEYSIYNMIFSEVKRKCKFDNVQNNEDGGSVSFYNCPNAHFKGKIGFTMIGVGGLIIMKTSESLKELDSLMGDFIDDNVKVTGDPNASGYYGTGGGGTGGNYRLGNRQAISKPKPMYDCNEEGKVFVKISVDKTGKVFAAQTGVKGTTNSAPCLLTKAKEAALKTKFNPDSNAPSKQIGIIIYNFSLSD